MENSFNIHSQENSEPTHEKSSLNNKQILSSPSLDIPQFSLISTNNRKTYSGTEHPSKRWGHTVLIHNNHMIIFGGRHSMRILSNIYSLDFKTLNWSKLEPFGNSPPARDSHSAVLFNDVNMVVFGGNGMSGKLNDLWNFNFNDKRWSKIVYKGKIPSPRDGHMTSVIHKKYMVVYGGLNNEDKVIQDVHLFDLENRKWYQCDLEGVSIQNKDGQSCCMLGNTIYLFGGQGPSDDEYSNDLYELNFEIPEHVLDIKIDF